MEKIEFDYRPSKYIYCHKGDQSLEVHWLEEIPEKDLDQCLSIVSSFLNVAPARNLVIDGIELKDSEFSLNWKIIEHTWKSFYENGGKKIVIQNKKKLPRYIREEYEAAIKDYGIPLKIDFK